MNLSFFKSFQPISKPLQKVIKKHRLELFFICIALVLSIVSIAVFVVSSNNNISEQKDSIVAEPINQTPIFVDIGGAVVKPDLYEATSGTRLKQIITLAGGLSDNVAHDYFVRNFNLARIITDQEKIYVPSIQEINSGIIIENSQLNTSTSLSADNGTMEQSVIININSASIDELDTLPGIGITTALKIIQNRPYSTIEDLLNKKVVKKNVFEQIKGLVTVN